MIEKVEKALDIVLQDWEMMQKTSGDEGEQWAETFEHHFYLFIEELEQWYHSLDSKRTSLEEAEQIPDIHRIQKLLPGPLQLNFVIELERIVEGEEATRYD